MLKKKKKTKHGGKRKGAGRKHISDPKLLFSIRIKESVVKHFGGKENTKQELLKINDTKITKS
jgi:hypothetical protein